MKMEFIKYGKLKAGSRFKIPNHEADVWLVID